VGQGAGLHGYLAVLLGLDVFGLWFFLYCVLRFASVVHVVLLPVSVVSVVLFSCITWYGAVFGPFGL